MNRLVRLINQRKQQTTSLIPVLNKEMVFLDSITIAPVVLESVSVLKPKQNESSEVKDPLSIFKKNSNNAGLLGPFTAAAALFGTLFHDNIISSVSSILTKIDLFDLETVADSFTSIKDEVVNTVIEIPTTISDTIRNLEFPDIVSALSINIIPDSQLEKLFILTSKIKTAVSGIFGGFISNPFNIFNEAISSGKFALTIATWVFAKTKGIFDSIISFGNKGTDNLEQMNAQYSENKFEPTQEQKPTKIIERVKRLFEPAPSASSGASDSSQTNTNTDSIANTNLVSSGASGPTAMDQQISESEINAGTITPFQKKGRTFWTSPQPWLKAIIAVESGGDPLITNSFGYVGLFQMGSHFKINRKDPHQSLAASKKFWLRDCIPALKKQGLPITPFHIYMTHQQGPGRAPIILKRALQGYTGITGTRLARIRNGGVKNGRAMNDTEFINEKWRPYFAKKSATGLGGGNSANIKSLPDAYKVLAKHEPDGITTIEVDKIPAKFRNMSEQQKNPYSSIEIIAQPKQYESLQAGTIESTIAQPVKAVRLNSPSIINMTLSTRML